MLPSFTLNFTDLGTPFCLIAALLYLIKYKELDRVEKPIVIVIWLNLICDLLGFFLSEYGYHTGIIYNFLLPTERILSLLVYSMVAMRTSTKRVHLTGIATVILIRIIATLHEAPLTKFQDIANTSEALIVALMSYVFIRSMLTEKAEFSIVLFAFGIANFLYLTFMASAMSALRIARSIDNAYATALYSINTIAYIFWTLILISALLWKKKI